MIILPFLARQIAEDHHCENNDAVFVAYYPLVDGNFAILGWDVGEWSICCLSHDYFNRTVLQRRSSWHRNISAVSFSAYTVHNWFKSRKVKWEMVGRNLSAGWEYVCF